MSNNNNIIPPSASYMMVNRRDRYYNFENAMAYHFSQEDKNEYPLMVTIAEMNLIRECLRCFRATVFKRYVTGLERDVNSYFDDNRKMDDVTIHSLETLGATEQNADKVEAKIENVQLDIYEQSPGPKLIQVVDKKPPRGMYLVMSDHIEEDLKAIIEEGKGDYGDLDSQL